MNALGRGAEEQAARSTPAYVWGTLFTVNMVLVGLGRIFDLIDKPVAWILFALNMVLFIPLGRASLRRSEQCGATSPALRRYNRRILTWSAVYMVAMIGGANLSHVLPERSPAMWAVALATIAPVLAMIWSMARYLAEENDEYLRFRAIRGALSGLAAVLCLGTAWGFLEMFGLLPHVWAWWVFPAWAFGMGLGMWWFSGNSSGDADDAA